MKVRELIELLEHCNPNLPVMCESDSAHGHGWTAQAAIFARRTSTDFADFYQLGHGEGEHCVLIRQYPIPSDDD